MPKIPPYTLEFKREAVKLLRTGEDTHPQPCQFGAAPEAPVDGALRRSARSQHERDKPHESQHHAPVSQTVRGCP